MIRVVLVEPEGEINVGSVARLCKNFVVDQLYIVNPKIDLKKSYEFAVKGSGYLENARIVNSLEEALEGMDIKISTSSIADKPGDLMRKSVKPWEIGQLVHQKNVALVFGRESVGLTRQEIGMTDFLVHIPANPEYPVMNLSHSVGILLYEIYKFQLSPSSNITKDSISLIERYFEELKKYLFKNDQDFAMLYTAKRVMLRGIRDEEEARTSIRFLRKILLKFQGAY